MDTLSLKRYIYENNKIEYVLESIGCYNIKYHAVKGFYSCSNYNGDNPGAVNVKNNEYLNVVNWTRQKEFSEGSDIFDLVQYNKQCSFVKAVKYLHEILNLEYTPYKKQKKKEEKPDPLIVFKRVLLRKRRVNVADINVLDECILDEYVPLLHISWLRDGIMQRTRDKFGLTYSYKRRRVIIPMRHWLTGELLGINARTTIDNYEELGIKKYYLTPSYPKNLNLFGLYENYDSIQEAGYVVVYEAERSVLKRDSLNDATGVALSGHAMSDEQARILIGLNVEIVIALDKDIPLEEVWSICEKFYHIRRVSYIYDSYDLLGSKDSPADASNKIFNFLFKYRTQYGSEDHNKYLQSLKK